MPEPNRPLKVFLCHASADKQAVRELYKRLEDDGVDAWLDSEDLIPGQNWRVEIPKAVEGSDIVLVCLSENSVSKEGYVQKEIVFALDKAMEMPEGRIFLIPVRLEDCEVPRRLSEYQWVDLFNENGFERLMLALKLRAEQIGADAPGGSAEPENQIEDQSNSSSQYSVSDLTGHYIGRYHILERLGRGGMAIVYKAHDTRIDRDVAIKVIRLDHIRPARFDEMLKRFEREAKILASLHHTNIVQIYDYGEYNRAPYFVMEYLPGGTLSKKLGKPIPWRDAVKMLLPAAHGLAHAHKQKIIHLDIKPDNIIFDIYGNSYVDDFGVAKIIDVADSTLTGSGIVIGTLQYMAPEQFQGMPSDSRTDIYSLGIVLYEMLAGRVPYDADTAMAVMFMQINDPLPSLRKKVPELPENIEKIVSKALSKEKENRYQDMNAFIEALEKCLDTASS